MLIAALALSCTVIDGDTIRCASENGRDERVRLSGIDAPETSRCRRGRSCVKGDGQKAKRVLEILIDDKVITIERLGKDRYGRTIAAVYADGVNVACAMLAQGQAVYRARWDNDGVVARDCAL